MKENIVGPIASSLEGKVPSSTRRLGFDLLSNLPNLGGPDLDVDLGLGPDFSDPSIASFSEDESFLSSPVRLLAEVEG